MANLLVSAPSETRLHMRLAVSSTGIIRLLTINRTNGYEHSYRSYADRSFGGSRTPFLVFVPLLNDHSSIHYLRGFVTLCDVVRFGCFHLHMVEEDHLSYILRTGTGRTDGRDVFGVASVDLAGQRRGRRGSPVPNTLLDPPEFKSEAVRDLFLWQRNTWRGFPRATQELMLRNLRETIMDKVNQENRVLKERREGFADNHEAVHAELERQLSSRNPRRPAAREPTPINTGARGLVGRLESQLERELSSQEPRRAAAREPTPINTDSRVLEGHQESQDASQESAKSFDFSQSAFARALRGLDAESVTFDDSLDLMLEQEQESAANPALASCLSLNLDDFQEDQAAAGENVRQNGDEVI
ncbi:hypothetical protein B9Z19DRAFT_1138404 [Tuber borchii]|uniref:Uncharacterized protein n=1 Tax=Tuber borchii TaxID=42251 RepID=A0A2T6Z9S6_TUBBO|nr:hypothetical protein B9Z19DRAFT_1138404 [Tuber borchii]